MEVETQPRARLGQMLGRQSYSIAVDTDPARIEDAEFTVSPSHTVSLERPTSS